MTKRNKDNITDEEIQVVLEFVLEQFQLSVEQIEIQKEKIVKFLLDKDLVEPAKVLEKNLNELQQKVALEIEMCFPVKPNDNTAQVFSDNSVKVCSNKEEFFVVVEDVYQRYVVDANSLLVDMVNYLKEYFPDDFNKEEYLNIRVRKK